MCLYCGENFRGRTDKKFCTDYCRSAHHNRLRCSQYRRKKKIQKILNNNRKILFSLYKSGRTHIGPVELDLMGYDHDFLTHEKKLGDGLNARMSFDIGIIGPLPTGFEIYLEEEHIESCDIFMEQ